jgi:hypothetical protein
VVPILGSNREGETGFGVRGGAPGGARGEGQGAERRVALVAGPGGRGGQGEGRQGPGHTEEDEGGSGAGQDEGRVDAGQQPAPGGDTAEGGAESAARTVAGEIGFDGSRGTNKTLDFFSTDGHARAAGRAAEEQADVPRDDHEADRPDAGGAAQEETVELLPSIASRQRTVQIGESRRTQFAQIGLFILQIRPSLHFRFVLDRFRDIRLCF